MSGVKWAAFGMWTLSGMALVLVDSVFLHDIHVMLPVAIKNRIKQGCGFSLWVWQSH